MSRWRIYSTRLVFNTSLNSSSLTYVPQKAIPMSFLPKQNGSKIEPARVVSLPAQPKWRLQAPRSDSLTLVHMGAGACADVCAIEF